MLINYGYTIKTKDLKVDYQTARKIMKSNNRLKFSRVDCDSDRFVFRTEYIECPICHAKYDAREIMPSEPVVHTPYEIERFLEPQVDFNNFNKNHSLQLNNAVFKGKSNITCPFCLNTIYRTNDKRRILLSQDSEKLTVKIAIKNIQELIECLFAVSDALTIDIGNEIMRSSWEVLTLDKGGKTYLSFENEFNNETFRKDITEAYNEEENNTCLSIISNNEKIKEYIIAYLKQFWNTEFPFNVNELEFADIIALNRFKGFNKSFYYSVPYELGKVKIEESFTSFSIIYDAIGAFDFSSLPKSKTIKKIMLSEKQGFLFYIPELERLYECVCYEKSGKEVKNTSIFGEILNLPHINLLLYYLHTYPIVDVFINEYCKTGEQTRKFVELLKKSVGLICEKAIDFGGKSEFYKKKMAERHFKNVTDIIGDIDVDMGRDYYYQPKSLIRSPYSMPMNIPERMKSLEDTVFDCEFKFLYSTNETLNAGKKLSNCLTGWTCTDENVIVVKRGTNIVAAIQLSYRGTRVVQAKLAHNDDIQDDEKIFAAFWAWCNKHDLVYSGFYEYEDDEEEIA